TYDIVEDTCQDGIFNGSDSILHNAITVAFPSDVPPLPSPAIAAMKAGAQQQADHWEEAALMYEHVLKFGMKTMDTTLTKPLSDYLKYACSMSSPGAAVEDSCPAFGIEELRKAGLLQIVNKSLHYAGIAADPPDPDFEGPSVPGSIES